MTRTQIKAWAKSEWNRQMAEWNQEQIKEWQREHKTNRTPTDAEIAKWGDEKPAPF